MEYHLFWWVALCVGLYLRFSLLVDVCSVVFAVRGDLLTLVGFCLTCMGMVYYLYVCNF